MKSHRVAVIDYGVGNLLSVQRGLESCGADVIISNKPDEILKSDHVVLPGVGAFGNAMQALERLDLPSLIDEIVKQGKPFLGICLGMQLLLDESEEFGIHQGLGLISGKVQSIPTHAISGEALKIPHIGWNNLVKENNSTWENTWLNNNKSGDAMYFVHSFMANPLHQEHRLADCIYGGHRIAAVIRKNNIMGCQFHPEKSGILGLKILQEFLR
jgi:imidazole glycerol-phosphate synthase subunit HisH